jgi:dolichyl-phosphate beta-glucosyltransferase
MRHVGPGTGMSSAAAAPAPPGVPAISIVVPVLNEESCIEGFLELVSHHFSARGFSWEIVVVDDGSTDRTAALVEQWIAEDARVRLLRHAHAGKGSAVRHGMLAARGAWRFMADADLSVAPRDWSGLLDAALEPAGADVIVASREGAGARRIGEPPMRHVIGRVFNRIVQVLAVAGINDTQCGFKLFSGAAADAVFPHLTVAGFAFDVEALFLARRAGFRIREVGVTWTCRTDSRVGLARGGAAFADILRIRWQQLRGRYRGVRAARSNAYAPGRDPRPVE